MCRITDRAETPNSAPESEMGNSMLITKWLKGIRDGYVIRQVRHAKLPVFYGCPTVRKNIIFCGRVQKVGFRLELSELAKRMELTGWVKNRSDKSVEAELQGEEDKIKYLIHFMKALKRASVREVIIHESAVIKDEPHFIKLG
jgi:acylphosphatase